MGSKAFILLGLFPIPVSHKPSHRFSSNNYRREVISGRCFPGGRSCSSRWNSGANVKLDEPSRLSDAYLTEDCVDENDFGLRNAEKKRVWWFDDFADGDDDDEEKDQGFGVLEASIGFNWISKVFGAFGWMIPAVITSLVLGNGHDSIFMALALPLAQTIFSLVSDALRKKPSGSLRPKMKSSKRSFPRTATSTRSRRSKETSFRSKKRSGDYTSWATSSDTLSSTGNKNSRDFGGWDELDN